MLKSRGPGPDSLTWKNKVVCHCKITSQELLTDPNYAPESAKSVSTSRTGSHACDRVVTLRENLSTISSLFVCLFVALRPKSKAMVIAGRSVHLSTLFPGQA